MAFTRQLKLSDHYEAISQKISFVTYKLYGMRKREHLKLNINLFKVLIMPLYRLCFSIYITKKQSDPEARDFLKKMRGRLKIFALIPMNTSNELLDLISGLTDSKLQQYAATIEKNLAQWESGNTRNSSRGP